MAAPIYKQFAATRTAFYLLAALLFLLFPAMSMAAANPAYTVEGVEVDVTAENAVKAREKALDEAQVKAYQMLAERFLGPDELKTFKMPDPITISSVVQDYEVTNEQLSMTRYKGVFTVRFRPNAMKTQMASQGKTYSDVQKKPVLVLPFYQVGGSTTLWSETNPFMRAWRAMPGDKTMLNPTVLPLGDANDMAEVNDSDALQYDPMEAQKLANRYGADDIAVLVASSEPTSTVEGRLTVNIYNNGFEGPVFVQKVSIDQLPNEPEDALFARAALKIKGLLRTNWKANAAYVAGPAPATTTTTVTTTTYGQPNPQAAAQIPYTRQALGASKSYGAHARFASVQDWVRLKNTLDRVYGVQAVIIKSLKPREAVMDIRYAGEASALQLALQNAGIIMRASPGGGLELYLSSNQPVYRQ
jgi:hypothetical protein